ncbi:MAG TPA: hypothetical protein PKE45_26385 [Caldilineaceae bacterium]|nr:hypothetical protein [Caldilineaceae bacterium]
MISATVRDIAIIIIAIQTIVIGVLLGVLIWQLWRLAQMIQTEIKPIVADTQETLSTVRGTTTFVSDSVVNPVVRASSTMIRYQRMLRSLTAELRPQRSLPPQPPPPPPSGASQ